MSSAIPVTMYVHHVIAPQTERMSMAFYAAVMVAESAPKPKVVRGWAEVMDPDYEAVVELKAAARALAKLERPCKVTVVLKSEILRAVAPDHRRSTMAKHYLAGLTRHKLHQVQFAALDGQPHAGEFMGMAMIAAIALHDEWEAQNSAREDKVGV